MSKLHLEKLSRRYGRGGVAVDGISLEVAAGECLALVGPSGGGKSTTLRMIAGLEKPDQGRVRIDDRDITALRPSARGVAMVFQNFALYPHMNIRQNLAFPLRMRRVPKLEREQRVQQAAAMLRLEPLLGRRPGQLSGGEQQRAALGRALVQRPDVFLLDEPLSNLDPLLRRELRREIRRIIDATGITTIYVTHDQDEALALGDRVAVMARGRLQQVGLPEAMGRAPANAFIARFIGSSGGLPPMNLLPGRVETRSDHLHFMEEAVTEDEKCAPLSLALPGHWRVPMDQPGRSVQLGFRPQAGSLQSGDDDASDGALIELFVDRIDELGAAQEVIARTPGGHEVVVYLPPGSLDRAVMRGARLPLHLRRDDLHLFEGGEFGQSLRASTANTALTDA